MADPQVAPPVSYPALQNNPTNSNGYEFFPDGKGGINYFYNGQPITNTEFRQATGTDTSMLEDMVKQNYSPQTTTNSTNAFAAEPNTSVTSGPTGGATGGNSSYYLPPVTYLGQTYDQNDPAQAAALLAKKQETLGGQRDQQIAQITRQLNESLQNASLQQGQQLGGFQQNAADYGRSLANNIVDLGQGYDLGLVNNQQRFAGLSPNAFQSGQATSQQYAGDQYNKGLNQLHQNAAETVGGDYLNNGQIDPNSAIGKQIAALNQQYNMFTGDAQNSAQLGIQSANNAYGSGMDQNLSSLQALYNYAGVPQFNFQSQGYNPNQMPSVDISKYTPFTNASQLGQSPQAQPTSPATWTGSGNPFSGLLGYNPNSTQSNYLNAFLGRTQPATAGG